MEEVNFKRPELEDQALIRSYFDKAPSRSCERTFVDVYLWSRHYKVTFAVIEECSGVPGRRRNTGVFLSGRRAAECKKSNRILEKIHGREKGTVQALQCDRETL